MKKILPISLLVASITFVSCNNSSQEETSNHDTATTKCTFTVDTTQVAQVNWTAFKTNAKIGVGGKFDEVSVTGGEAPSGIDELLNTIKFSINTGSTNSNNPVRDVKIVASFFSTMDSTQFITGNLLNVIGNDSAGSCQANLVMNQVQQTTMLNYVLDADTLRLTGEVDITNFKALDALASLNSVCLEKHTGEDGESITWPNVAVNITAVINRHCN